MSGFAIWPENPRALSMNSCNTLLSNAFIELANPVENIQYPPYLVMRPRYVILDLALVNVLLGILSFRISLSTPTIRRRLNARDTAICIRFSYRFESSRRSVTISAGRSNPLKRGKRHPALLSNSPLPKSRKFAPAIFQAPFPLEDVLQKALLRPPLGRIDLSISKPVNQESAKNHKLA